MKPIKPCPECGEQFDNVFDATDHLLEDDEEFDPALILPNGYRLMIGSLLRCMYRYADDAEKIKDLTQDTYMTLFTVEMEPDTVVEVIEEMIVGSSMAGLDEELKQLLEGGE
jgi:predicted metal-binding transcription factor (methanogenesis marker protein 9)